MAEKLTAAKLRSWLRRAETIEAKVAALFSDMMDTLGEEHEGTDYADNVGHMASDLVGWLASYQRRASLTKAESQTNG